MSGPKLRSLSGGQAPAKQPVEKPKPDPVAEHEKELKAWLENRQQNQEPPEVVKQSDERIKVMMNNLMIRDGIKTLLKEQYDAAQTEATNRWKGFMAGRETLDILHASSVRLLQAELDLSDQQADAVAGFEAHWRRMKDAEIVSKNKYDAGRLSVQDFAQSRYNRVRAEIWLERAKAGRAVNLDRRPVDISPAEADP